MAAPRELDLTVTLGQCLDGWADSLRARVAAGTLSPQTLRNYTQYARYMVTWLGPDRTCDSVEACEITDYLVAYRNREVPRQGAKTPGAATIRMCHKAAKGLLGHAWAQRWLRENPMRDVAAPPLPGRRPMPERAALSRPELDQVIAAAKAGHGSDHGGHASWARDEIVVRLAAESGLRNADIQNLDLPDVEAMPEGYWVVQITSGKGRKARTVPISTACAELIADYVENHRPDPAGVPDRYDAYGGLVKGDQNALLLTAEGCRLNQASVRYIVAGCAQAALGRHHVPHGLRHTAGTLLAREAKADLAVVAHILGHSDISVTSVYLDTRGEEAAAAVNRRKVGARAASVKALPPGRADATWPGECGTRRGYSRHRREKVPKCGLCVQWHRQEQQELDVLRRAMPARLHGTVTGWRDWRCRCDPCREAHLNPPKPQPANEPAPCGTETAYQRHIRRAEEVCGPCDEAHRVWLVARRTPREEPVCGTPAAYRRHCRLGEQACRPCLDAVAEASQVYLAVAGQQRRAGVVRPKAVCGCCEKLRSVTAAGVIRKHDGCPGSGEAPAMAPLRLATDPELWQAEQHGDVA